MDGQKFCHVCGKSIDRLDVRTVTKFRMAKFCSRACASRSRAPRSLVERFWEKVWITAPSECWLWTASRHPSGYGMIGIPGGKHRYARRVSLEIATGSPIPPGKCVRHACDNPPCVNPAHLSVGSAADNAADAVSRGRTTAGERSASAKLSTDKVRLIRWLVAEGAQISLVARHFAVSPGAIAAIRDRKTWSHVS